MINPQKFNALSRLPGPDFRIRARDEDVNNELQNQRKARKLISHQEKEKRESDSVGRFSEEPYALVINLCPMRGSTAQSDQLSS